LFTFLFVYLREYFVNAEKSGQSRFEPQVPQIGQDSVDVGLSVSGAQIGEQNDERFVFGLVLPFQASDQPDESFLHLKCTKLCTKIVKGESILTMLSKVMSMCRKC